MQDDPSYSDVGTFWAFVSPGQFDDVRKIEDWAYKVHQNEFGTAVIGAIRQGELIEQCPYDKRM